MHEEWIRPGSPILLWRGRGGASMGISGHRRVAGGAIVLAVIRDRRDAAVQEALDRDRKGWSRAVGGQSANAI